jgi:hypothetical protein
MPDIHKETGRLRKAKCHKPSANVAEEWDLGIVCAEQLSSSFAFVCSVALPTREATKPLKRRSDAGSLYFPSRPPFLSDMMKQADWYSLSNTSFRQNSSYRFAYETDFCVATSRNSGLMLKCCSATRTGVVEPAQSSRNIK